MSEMNFIFLQNFPWEEFIHNSDYTSKYELLCCMMWKPDDGDNIAGITFAVRIVRDVQRQKSSTSRRSVSEDCDQSMTSVSNS